MIKYSLAFLAGNVFLHQFPHLNAQLFLQFFYTAVWLAFTLFILGYFSRSYHYKKIFYSSFIFCLFFFIAFFSNYYHAEQSFSNAFPQQLEGREIVVQGYIDSMVSENEQSIKFNFRLSSIVKAPLDYANSQYSQRIRLSWYKNSSALNLANLKVGDYWQLKVKLKRPSGLLNPGGMDFEKWLFAHQIRAVGYIRKGNENKYLLGFQTAIQQLSIQQTGAYALDRLRQKMARKLRDVLAGNEFKGIYLALAMGIKDQITTEQWKVFIDSGTNHLIAISGLHIGLFASLGFFIGKALWSLSGLCLKLYPAQLAGAFFALIFALVYAAMAGFSIPTQRALIMLSLALSAFFFKRRAPPALILSYALILVLILDPMASLSMGFWLSFTAVAVILYSLSAAQTETVAVNEIEDKTNQGIKLLVHHSLRRALKVIGKLSRMQIIIFLGLLPFSLLFFSRLLLVSPIANLLAVPWMSLIIIPLVLLSAVISIFSAGLSGFLFMISSYLMQPLWLFLNYLTQIESNYIYPDINNPLLILSGTLGLLLFFFFKNTKTRWLFLVLLFPLILPHESLKKLTKTLTGDINQGQFKVFVLDVGQGLSVVVQTQNHVLIYDTGNAYSTRFDMAKQVLIPFLRYYSIHKIDKLLLSHADHDHVGSAPSLLAQFQADDILSGEPERLVKKLDIHARQCHAGQKWFWDQVEFQVLYPQNTDVDLSYKSNNRSCVVLVKSTDGLSLLLTGDIEKKIEKKLYGLKQLKNIDILIAPHHGSKSSSSIKFLSWLNPKMVVFTNGYLNRYHFPAEEVVQRYKQLGSQLYTTQNGLISIYRDGLESPITVTEYRKDDRHYWNRPHKALQ